MFALVLMAVIRRLYDTRVYSTVRVALGQAQTGRAGALPISTLNARLGKGRELTLPVTLRRWLRLSEITERLNAAEA